MKRALIRYVVEGRLTETAAARLRVLMTRIMSGWSVAAITSEVLASGRSRFPKEVLSLDDRVRDNARLLGFTVVPS